MARLRALLDLLEQAFGPAEPVPSADWWELVLAENIAYLVDDRRRWTALARLRDTVGLDPDRILAASDLALADAVTAESGRHRTAPDGAHPATRTPTAAPTRTDPLPTVPSHLPAMPADPRLPQRERRTPAVLAG